MFIYYLCEERKELVEVLEKKLGVESKYLGLPTYKYLVGPYTVNLNGTIEIEDEKADLELLKELNAMNLIDNSWDQERERLDVSIFVQEHFACSLINLLKIIYCRGEQISRAIGTNDAFSVDEDLIVEIIKDGPISSEEFLKVWEEAAGNTRCKGIMIDRRRIHFTGFSKTSDENTVKAYREFVKLINLMSQRSKRINFEKPRIENEKYSFRVWLLRLGMIGDEYAETRRILLSKLPGSGSFRTKEQEEVAKKKLRESRLNTKEKRKSNE